MPSFIIVSSDFDPEVYVYEIKIKNNTEEIYKKAKAFLHWKWEDCLNHSFLEEIKDFYHEDTHGEIIWENGKRIEFILLDNLDEYLLTCHFESVPNEFEEVWKGYV